MPDIFYSMTIAQEAVDLARRNQHKPVTLMMGRAQAEKYAKFTGHPTVEAYIAQAWKRNITIRIVEAEEAQGPPSGVHPP